MIIRRRHQIARIALVSTLCPLLAACAGEGSITGPTETSGSGRVVAYGSCGSTPNYAGALDELHRFASFPVSVSINVSGNIVSATWQPRYREAIRAGIQLWSQALGGGMGQVDVSYDNPGAAVQVNLVAVAPDNTVSGRTFFLTGRLLSSARIDLYRAFAAGAGVGGLERFVDGGTMTVDQWSRYIMQTAAHEMGHALAMNGHSRNPADLMAAGEIANLPNYTAPPLSWLTSADINTMREAYCRS